MPWPMIRTSTSPTHPEVTIQTIFQFLERAPIWRDINTGACYQLQSFPLAHYAFLSKQEFYFYIGAILIICWLSLQDKSSIGKLTFQKLPETGK